MRIQITGTGQEQIPETIIVHGKVPRPPRTSCFNCNKKDDCNILRTAITSIDAIGSSPLIQNLYADYAELPIPMPCRGISWQAIPSRSIENDPLVQRLGLSHVRDQSAKD